MKLEVRNVWIPSKKFSGHIYYNLSYYCLGCYYHRVQRVFHNILYLKFSFFIIFFLKLPSPFKFSSSITNTRNPDYRLSSLPQTCNLLTLKANIPTVFRPLGLSGYFTVLFTFFIYSCWVPNCIVSLLRTKSHYQYSLVFLVLAS